MFNHSFKSKYKKCFIVCILVMAMLLTASMPINAMEENEQPESNTEKITEVQAEAPVADDMEAAETVSAGTQNNSNSLSEQTVQATESNESVVPESDQMKPSADAGSLENEEGVRYALAPADYTKVTFEHNFDSSVLPTTPGNGVNEWQIIRGGYKGRYTTGQDVSDSFDKNANVSYSNDNAVRMTKNVISTDTENEFHMYLNVEPQVSWEEILQLNTIIVSHNNRPLSPPAYPAGGGKSETFSPVKTGNYRTPINFVYYANSNGKKIILETRCCLGQDLFTHIIILIWTKEQQLLKLISQHYMKNMNFLLKKYR